MRWKLRLRRQVDVRDLRFFSETLTVPTSTQKHSELRKAMDEEPSDEKDAAAPAPKIEKKRRGRPAKEKK